jgi:hypothetical protein
MYSVVDGTIPFPVPVVLGHEGADVVEAVSVGVTHVEPGDHVALSTLADCGTCAECDRGRPTMCRKATGVPQRPFARSGEPLYRFAANSAFAERTVVKAVQAVRVPKDIPLTSAALIGCGVLTGVGAVLNRARAAGRRSPAGPGAGPEGAPVGGRGDAEGRLQVLAHRLGRAEAGVAGHVVDGQVAGLQEMAGVLHALLGEPLAGADTDLLAETPGEGADRHGLLLGHVAQLDRLVEAAERPGAGGGRGG